MHTTPLSAGFALCACSKEDPKFIYYLSAEFLMGRSLLNTVQNLELTGPYSEAIKSLGYSLEALVDAEQNAALGIFLCCTRITCSRWKAVGRLAAATLSLCICVGRLMHATCKWQRQATAAWGAWRPASSTAWPPWTSLAGATASATSTACSSRY